MKNKKYFLTIAAADTSGGAGITQDLKMAQTLSFWGLSVITAITAQDFQKVYSMETVSEKIYVAQLKQIFEAFKISAIKIGVIPNQKFAEILADFISQCSCPIVYDPVILSTSNFSFAGSEIDEIIKSIWQKCTVITPNIPEWEYISKLKINTPQKPAIYLKGGHSTDNKIIEHLYIDEKMHKYIYDRYKWEYTHGTGCAFSSLLSMLLVDNDIKTACEKAREYVVKFYEEICIGRI